MRIGELAQKRELGIVSLACVVAAVIWAWALWPRPPALRVTFLNVGQGDSIVLQTPGGRTVLIDCGTGPSERDDFDAGAKVVVPFLRREGINKIDALILTHPHGDHVGGAAAVLRDFEIENFFDAGIAHTSGDYLKLLSELDERSVAYHQAWRGQVIDFNDGVTLEVLNPARGAREPDDDSDLNNSSVVLRLTYGKVRFLLAGDADKEAEQDILSSSPDVSADLLKVAHHGGSGATSAEWVAAVNPEVAVISVGYRNPFGHPSAITLSRLQDAGIRLYRTDHNGGITATTDGRAIAVSTSREWR